MKKALLIVVALMLIGSGSAANIATSGSARMGLVYDNAENFFSSSVRILFTASGETDTGLSFGASVRADQSGGNGSAVVDGAGDTHVNGTTGTFNSDSTVFISGAFGELTMGDVAGAADELVAQVSSVGFGPYQSRSDLPVTGTVKTAVYYEFTRGTVTFGAGVGQLDPTDPMDPDEDTYSAGLRYAGGVFSLALAYESANSLGETLHLGATASLGPATVTARVADYDLLGSAYAVSVDYSTGPTTITGFLLTYEDVDVRNYGLGVAYDLGGGATVAGGVIRASQPFEDSTLADIGLEFSF